MTIQCPYCKKSDLLANDGVLYHHVTDRCILSGRTFKHYLLDTLDLIIEGNCL